MLQSQSPIAHGVPSSGTATAVHIWTVLLPRTTCAGLKGTGLQPLSLLIHSLQMAEIFCTHPPNWLNRSAAQNSRKCSTGLLQRLANRSLILPLELLLAKARPPTSTVPCQPSCPGAGLLQLWQPQSQPPTPDHLPSSPQQTALLHLSSVLKHCSSPHSSHLRWAQLAGIWGTAVQTCSKALHEQSKEVVGRVDHLLSSFFFKSA